MHITIDAVPLLVPSSGIKNYLHYWTRNLQALGTARITLFPWLQSSSTVNHQSSPLGRISTAGRIAALHLANLPGVHLLDWLASADVFHASKVLNPPRNARLTATLHDLTCWLMPEVHTPANVTAEKRFAERIWRRADGLIAPSESTRADAVRLLGLRPDRIRVIPHGVADSFFTAGAAEAEHIRVRYFLPERYILSVGTVEPRKNLDRAMEAYCGLAPDIREEYGFVIAGPLGWAAAETASRLREAPAGVRYLGYLPESDLPGLTAGASVLLYPSLYEGFGFPVAQAMAAGVPVVTSNVSALPETAGAAALFADPASPGEIRSCLERVLLSPALRERLGAAGRLRADRYRWCHCAGQSMDFFRVIASE